ncbi:hypothetical protein ACRWQM_01540 [Shewanella sp. HL-SH5]|uniref:hypothetical protein n=1 Tax=Shewanella sp. HL-SH5 TaxID=3436241 RepID=UPI003EBA9F34
MEFVLSLIACVIMALITFIISSSRERQLDDPNDTSVVYLDKLQELSNLQDNGKYLLRIIRQSGNLQKDDQILDCPNKAIKAAISTLKRAKIDFVLISKNTEVEFFFRRTFHHHGGSAEGQKVGSVEIYKIE